MNVTKIAQNDALPWFSAACRGSAAAFEVVRANSGDAVDVADTGAHPRSLQVGPVGPIEHVDLVNMLTGPPSATNRRAPPFN